MPTFAGIRLKNPIVVASSPLTARPELLKMAENAGAAGVSTKLTFIKQPFYGELRMYNDPRVGSIVCHDRRLDLAEGARLVEEGKETTSLVIFTNITYEGEDLEGWAVWPGLWRRRERILLRLISSALILALPPRG